MLCFALDCMLHYGITKNLTQPVRKEQSTQIIRKKAVGTILACRIVLFKSATKMISLHFLITYDYRCLECSRALTAVCTSTCLPRHSAWRCVRVTLKTRDDTALCHPPLFPSPLHLFISPFLFSPLFSSLLLNFLQCTSYLNSLTFTYSHDCQ
jgi:hypothetical protein